jgi:hypothetical protein
MSLPIRTQSIVLQDIRDPLTGRLKATQLVLGDIDEVYQSTWVDGRFTVSAARAGTHVGSFPGFFGPDGFRFEIVQRNHTKYFTAVVNGTRFRWSRAARADGADQLKV